MKTTGNEFGQMVCKSFGLDANMVSTVIVRALPGRTLEVHLSMFPDADMIKEWAESDLMKEAEIYLSDALSSAPGPAQEVHLG